MAYADYQEDTLDELSPARAEHDRMLRQYVSWFEESEQSSQTSREKAERDRDYYDGKQWTEDESNELKNRGQPVIALNVIRARINYHLGMEKKQRRDPKCFGRGPEDQQSAELATEALRYCIDRTDYQSERSRVWENIKVEGVGAIECSMVDRQDGNKDVKWRQIPWDRFFADPHSARPDYTDAQYLGQVKWMDEDELTEEYPDGGEAVERALNGTDDGGGGFGLLGNTYEDRPRWQMWADPKRKRLRVVQLWYRQGKQWFWCEFVKGGILAAGPSPYQNDDGETICGVIAESCYVDRENNRYGEVRDLVDPQDEVNKRRSKALHAVNTNLVITENGALPDGDIEKARREANRPDGFISVNKGFRFEIDRNTDMAMGQSQLLAQAQAHIAATGPNSALLGKGTEDQSGRAIQAQQAGGLIELGDGLDVLRRLDRRVFKATWYAIRQYWTAPMWIRVTEDPDAPQFVGLNVPQIDQQTGQMQMNNLAEADVDIMIEDAPDVPTLEGETFAAVVEVLKSGVDPSTMRLVIEMHPSLPARTKKKLGKYIDEREQQAQQTAQAAQALEQAKAHGDLAAKDAKAKLDQGRLQFEMSQMSQGGEDASKAALEQQQLALDQEQMQRDAAQSGMEAALKREELAYKSRELDLKFRELEVRELEVRQNAVVELERMSAAES